MPPERVARQDWRCSECGDVLLRIEKKRLPKVCEICHSRLPFVLLGSRPLPLRVTRAAGGDERAARRCGHGNDPRYCGRPGCAIGEERGGA